MAQRLVGLHLGKFGAGQTYSNLDVTRNLRNPNDFRIAILSLNKSNVIEEP